MAGPTDRRRIGRVLAGVIREHGARIDVGALSDDLAESLIPASYLERLGRAIVDNIPEPQRVHASSPEAEIQSRAISTADAPTPDEMRNAALERIATATGGKPNRVGRGNAQTYQVGDGPRIYLRTRARDERQGDHHVYWFGLRLACWDDPNAWFVLQCDLDFAIVVPVEDWLPYKDRIGSTETGDQHQPHVHKEGNRIELRESTGLVLDVKQWVDNWEELRDAH